MYYTLKEFTGPNLREALYRRTNMQIHGTHMWYDYNTRSPATTRVNFDGEIGLTMDLVFERAFIRPLLSISTQGHTRERSGSHYSTGMDLTARTMAEVIRIIPHETGVLSDMKTR